MYKVRKGEIEKQVTSEVGMPLLFEEKTSYHDQLQIYICIGGFCESFKHKKITYLRDERTQTKF